MGGRDALGGSTQERSTVNPPPLVLLVSPFCTGTPPFSPILRSFLEAEFSLVQKLWSPAVGMEGGRLFLYGVRLDT